MYPLTNSADRQPEGYRQLAVSTTALALSAATGGIPVSATSAVIIVNTEPVRVRDDGTVPTSSAGMPYAAGSRIELNSRQQILQFRVIRLASSNSELNISYYSARKAYE